MITNESKYDPEVFYALIRDILEDEELQFEISSIFRIITTLEPVYIAETNLSFDLFKKHSIATEFFVEELYSYRDMIISPSWRIDLRDTTNVTNFNFIVKEIEEKERELKLKKILK